MRNRASAITVVAPLILLLAAGPLAAYTVYLKDGSRLIAREKYRVEDGRALIVLQNGTETFIDASEIDVQRTAEANQRDYGSALVLEDGEFREAPVDVQEPRRETLTGIARAGTASPTARQAPRGPEPAPRTSPAGYPDLFLAPRAPYRDLELAGELKSLFGSRGILSVQVWDGLERDRLRLEIATESEGSVLRSLQIAGAALLQLNSAQARRIAALELVFATTEQERAGQFVMTPEMASELVNDGLDPSTFFVRYVQF